jgi:hypothetical protein
MVAWRQHSCGANFTEQNPPWEANSRSDIQEITYDYYETRRFNSTPHTIPRLEPAWTREAQSTVITLCVVQDQV